ncbi:hypothetical protein [Croceimicrobium sp.]|uniref:hypothetical protein n=1 Tax=Croceimicrobium sp. TaxID=2828340 RepID=UPI003BAB25FC
MYILVVSCVENESFPAQAAKDIDDKKYCGGRDAIKELIYSSGEIDSLLYDIELGGLLPGLIEMMVNCQNSFDSIAMHVLLRCHFEAMERNGHGVLLSKEFQNHPSLLLFLSSYMTRSNNFSSSSHTNEIVLWAQRNKTYIAFSNKQYLHGKTKSNSE